jgi:anhydro-N-acetylmuramic acid kinase
MYLIGIMSGTSLDGVDAVLAKFNSSGAPQPLGFIHHDFSRTLRAELLALQSPGDNELARALRAANGVSQAYAAVTQALLAHCAVKAQDVAAIGAHGQTVRHSPGEGFTAQLLNPALLAQLTGVPVVHDFRSADIAAGGQGAPLVPAFHAQLFASPAATQVVCNLGGIANITVLPPTQTQTQTQTQTDIDTDADTARAVIGFDTGPANCLMDSWAAQHCGAEFDANGAFAASGTVLPALLSALLSEPYFALPAPKSTGRDLFNPAWLQAHLARHSGAPADVQATLAELTAQSVSDAIERYAPDAAALWLCGGGARNAHVVARLASLTGLPTRGTAAQGVDEQWVEALAFAWLAHAHIHGVAGNLPSVTGARAALVLGCLTPAPAHALSDTI